MTTLTKDLKVRYEEEVKESLVMKTLTKSLN